MPRTKGGFKTAARRRKVLKAAKGYWGGKHRLYRPAAEAVDRGLAFAYRDRRARKRDFRELWIIRINAGARANEITYSRLMSGLRKAGVEVNRKVLADLAATDQAAFSRLVAIAKENLPAQA